jgi:hypothetical protein
MLIIFIPVKVQNGTISEMAGRKKHTFEIDLHDITRILLKVAFNIIHLSIYLN